MASKRRNMFHKDKTQETTEKGMKEEICRISIGGWLNEGGAASGRRRRKATASQPVSSTPPALQGVIQHSDLERRRPDAFTPKKPPRWFKERTAAHHTFGHLPDYTDETKSAATVNREALVNMNAHMGIGGWLNEGGAASGRRRRKATASQPVSSTPPALQGVIQHSDLERRRPDAFTPKKPPRWFKERYDIIIFPKLADQGRHREWLVPKGPLTIDRPGGTNRIWALLSAPSPPLGECRPPQGVQGAQSTEHVGVSYNMTAAHHTFGHLPDYTDETKSAATVDREALVNMNAHMGIGGWLNEGGAASGRRRRKATASQPVSSTPPALQGVIQHSDLERRRPDAFTPKKPPSWFKERTSAHHTFGHLPDYTDETKSAATLDREAFVKMNAHMGYPEQTHLPMPEKHKFLHYMTKRPRRKPTGYMGNRRFLSRRYEPGNTVDDEIKEPMSNSYPEQTHLPMPEKHKFLHYMTKRPRRKSTGYMGNRRFLSTRYEPGNTVDDEIKEPMSNREKRTMGVNWNDWYSPIYDRSNRWLSSLVRKLPFSFDPKELKIIYPNNKKDTLYTPYTNLKAGEKKSRPLSLTTTIKTFMQLLFVRGKAIDTPYNAGGNNRAVIPATPQGFDIPHHHNPFSGMPVSGIRSFENSFAATPDDCHAGDPRSFPDEPLSKPSTDCAPA
ncbi:hypothetical protein AAG570_011114 [Ranatra chinensis]|uniref:Uncharacterized protein n=1 Tax=Ranatra chinensis TaxID=642074 RepID=A0ABD0YY14_9HEMI